MRVRIPLALRRIAGGTLHSYLFLILALALGVSAIVQQPHARADTTPSVGLGPGAVATSSEPNTRPGLLKDGRPTATRENVGGSWTGPARSGIWVEFSWSEGKRITSVQIYGAAGVGARIKSGLLTFGDGTSLEVGEILGDPAFPTTLAFSAKTVSSVRFTVTRIAGSGTIGLAEMRVYPVGSTPLRYGSPSASTIARDRDNPPCVPRTPNRASAGKIYVMCPHTYSRMRGWRTVHVYAPGLTQVGVAVWSPEARNKALPEQVVAVRTARASVRLNLIALPQGPVTVRIRAVAGPSLHRSMPVYFQLYHAGGLTPRVGARPSTAPGGRALVYAEEFNRPISLSMEGRNPGADYPTGKPEYWGAAQFSEAIFPDPAEGFDNLRVVDGRYLRMAVQPNPRGYRDPNPWGRRHIGAIIASARPGGSGFAARYGHFEARILAPAAPGTWPAMWLLPSDNLIEPKSTVAEIDAVELYGHDPRGACHTTHSYRDGQDTQGIALCGQRFATDQDAMRWHVYGVTVEPTEIVYWIDGKVVARAPQVGGGDKPMFLLLDLALGGGWPIALDPVQNRAAMYVDWFRVYA
jgi:hypothetical protein